ncbi:MAG TPA: DUF4136 domain-containing protein [Phnomibacter sp.]|nr:DUF4136 domain-containing protein [Phnomibacter sp.]
MKNTILTMAGIVLIVLSVVGCRKQSIKQLTDDESRVYITNRDASANFTTYRTVSVADQVLLIDGNSATPQNNAVDQAFISAFRTSLQQRGYTLVDKTANPDLGVQINRIIRTSTGVVAFPDYWGFWDPLFWGVPGAGWGFPGFWGVGTYQVREGMLSTDIVDLKNISNNNNQIRLLWNGIVRGNGIFNANTAGSQVQQLFEQSPYLRAN